MTLCFFVLLSSAARAGSYVWTKTDASGTVTSRSPTYSAGHVDVTGMLPVPYSGTEAYGGSGTVGNKPGGNASELSVHCFDAITATFTWLPNPALPSDPPPPSVILTQESTLGSHTNGAMTLAWSTGLGQSGTGLVSQTQTAYTGKDNPGPSFSITCSPDIKATIAAGAAYFSGGSCSVSYKVSAATPLTVNLSGTTPDANGNPRILIGQKCSATLSGIPTGCTPTNIQWSVSGWTVQANSWVVNSGSASATFTGPNAAYTFTQATPSSTPPSWYWDDNAGAMTVTCTATVTPPTGQGAAFSVTAKQVVALDAPDYHNTDPVGVVYLNSDYQGDPGRLYLHAGAGSDNIPGIYFKDTVNTPSLYKSSGTGTWYRIQLVSVSRYETSMDGTKTLGAPGNTVTGALDVPLNGTAYKYNSQTINADGTTFDPNHNTTAENDSPSVPVYNTQGEYKVVKEKYEDYIIYHPPGSNSIDVPLFYYQWSWNADVKIPPTPLPKSWGNWNNAPTAGTITAPGNDASQRMLIYPTWSSFSSQQLP